MAKLSVQLIGDAASLKAALGSAAAATDKFAADYKTAFASMSDSTLKLAVAQDKLAISTAKYGTGTTGAAASTLAYRRELESLHKSQLAAISSVGRAATTYVAAPTAFVSYEALKQAVDFNQQMLLIKTQAGDATDSIKTLSSQVLALTKVAPQGPTQLAEGLFHLVSLGLRGTDAMNTLKTASIAAGMGIADLQDVSTALGAAVVSNIKGAQDYQQAMATLVATAGAGNVRMGDLASSLGSVLPAAAGAGISLREVGAAMAVLTDRGFSADEAATRLRMSFALMEDPTKKAQKALADLGIKGDLMGKVLRQPNGLLTVLEALHTAVGRVGETRGNRDLLAAFGGGRSGLGLQTLVQSLDSPVSSYTSKLKALGDGEKNYAANQKTYLESPAYKLHQAWAEIQADLVKFGNSLEPSAVAAAGAVSKIADAFAALPGPVKKDLGIVIGLFAVGGPLLLAGVGVVKMVDTIGATFERLGLKAGASTASVDADLAGVGVAATGAEAKVAALEASFATLPEAAAAGTAGADAALVGVGAAATGAEAKVGLLRGSLLGLAGKVFVATIVVDEIVKHGGLKGFGEWISGGIKSGLKDIGAPKTLQHFFDPSYNDRGQYIGHPGTVGSGVALSPGGAKLAGTYGPYGPVAAAAAARFGVPTSMFLRQINQESGFNPNAVSSAGAEGIAQFMPGTAAGYHINPLDPNQALPAAAKMMASLYKKYGNWSLALAAYNAGSGTVDAYLAGTRGLPSETQNYVKSILGSSGQPKATGSAGTNPLLTTPGQGTGTAAKGGIGVLPPGMAHALLAAQIAAAGAAPGTKEAVATEEALKKQLERAKAYLEAHKQTVKVQKEELSLTKAIATVTKELAKGGVGGGGYITSTGGFQVPPAVQAQLARAGALAALTGGTGPTALQLTLARKVKTAEMKAIDSHKLTLQGLIDAWNAVATSNATLAFNKGMIDTYHTVSTVAITSGLKLTTAQQTLLEERLAQRGAHRGYAPSGPGIDGYGVVMYGPHFHGVTDVHKLHAELDKAKRSRHQRRGTRR